MDMALESRLNRLMSLMEIILTGPNGLWLEWDLRGLVKTSWIEERNPGFIELIHHILVLYRAISLIFHCLWDGSLCWCFISIFLVLKHNFGLNLIEVSNTAAKVRIESLGLVPAHLDWLELLILFPVVDVAILLLKDWLVLLIQFVILLDELRNFHFCFLLFAEWLFLNRSHFLVYDVFNHFNCTHFWFLVRKKFNFFLDWKWRFYRSGGIFETHWFKGISWGPKATVR